MGRKKKPFIVTKEAQRYNLVPRSHNDLKAGDAEEPQYALKPIDSLPEKMLCQVAPLQENLERVLPVSGPHPERDREIIEGLENPEIVCRVGNLDKPDKLLDEHFMVLDNSGVEVAAKPDQLLKENFMTLANSGEAGSPIHVIKQPDSNSSYDPHWWKDREDFEHSNLPPCLPKASGANVKCDSDANSVGSSVDQVGMMTHFTDYSMSSSVIPRSEALTVLDDHFEKFMEEYSDEQLGPGEDVDEAIANGVFPNPQYDWMLLQTAMEDFEKNFKEVVGDMEGKMVCYEDGSGNERTEPDDERNGAKEERREQTSREEKWDCESFLSTYSTLYNHPTRILEPRVTDDGSDGRSGGEIMLSRKTGIPLGVVRGPLPKENHPSRGTITRQRNESKEGKKARKHAMKVDRKQRRADKKATKLLFNSEAMKQSKTLNSAVHVAVISTL